jgi:CRISPR/Cas system CSM-associated protein Csm2 small subunit
MIATFTRNDIIRYVYLETSEEENFLIQQTLLTETHLQQFYEELLETKQVLDQSQANPSERVLQNILAYSRNFNVSRISN